MSSPRRSTLDLLQIAGQYGTKPDLPAVPGAEGVGEVVEVGEGAGALRRGQKVLLAGVRGTWRDEIVAPAAVSSRCRTPTSSNSPWWRSTR